MLHLFSASRFHRLERWLYILLGVTFCSTLTFLLIRFYYANTVLAPTTGGTYIEGSVGSLQPLNPWFTVTNDVNRDIVSLVFSGLLKYDPQSKKIESDLADLSISNGGKSYTLKLKDNLEWHDSTPEKPHPVTVEDVLFTYRTIKDPAFTNTLLRQNFQGVELEKVDNRTVRFKLEEPYSFFASNLTIGILPENQFTGIPVARLDQALDFGFAPIGAGPYKFKSLVQTELSTEITLERFERKDSPTHKLDRLIFRIFPDYNTLLSDIRNLDGIRLVPHNEQGGTVIPRGFTAKEYSLPQYVALFFNLDRPIVADKQLRLGLQLGTNKQALIDAIHEKHIVDTPLLEIDTSDWRYSYDPNAAQGAFFESDWHLPEKVRLQRLLEMREANQTGPLAIQPTVLLDTGAILTITGSLTIAGTGARLNGVQLVKNKTQTGTWIAGLPTTGGTGSIVLGNNLIRLTSEKGDIIDSFYVWRTADARAYKQALEEQRLLDLFVQTRANSSTAPEKILVTDLYLENGMLRKRLSTDPTDIRVNDKGNRLSLTLLTSHTPGIYKSVAEEIQRQWAGLGVHVGISIPDSREEFEEKLLSRDYDILLFGQSLLDNLDSYPYWHSSGVQRVTENKFDLRIDAYNLSQYSSLQADTLLETIRQTGDDTERQEALEKLREVLKNDIPAIFLYSPRYAFAVKDAVHGVDLENLSLHSDRFLTLQNWYLKEERVFQPGKSWFSFFGWLFSL